MMKRFLSLLAAALLLMLALVPTAMAEEEEPYEDPGYYYVYTANGKGLNVRKTPGGEIVGSLKYGSRVHVDSFTDENWALILYKYDNPPYGVDEWAAWVNRRFLVKKKPESLAERKAKKEAEAAATATEDMLTEINREFQSAKKVTPYKITVKPTRVSGWVNMRWAPSKSSEILNTYKANDALLVIYETANWLQVEDPETGDVGFVDKAFVAD